MAFEFTRIDYKKDLNARQKENYNFQKISAVLADYGFVTMRLSADWNGADFIALHIEGGVLHVQLKSRLTLQKKYLDQQDLYIAFPHGEDWYLYKHSELVEKVLALKNIASTASWNGAEKQGGYSWPRLDMELLELLAPYRLEVQGKGTVGISIERTLRRKTNGKAM